MGCWPGSEGDSAVRQSAVRCVNGQVQMRHSRARSVRSNDEIRLWTGLFAWRM